MVRQVSTHTVNRMTSLFRIIPLFWPNSLHRRFMYKSERHLTADHDRGRCSLRGCVNTYMAIGATGLANAAYLCWLPVC